MSNYLTRRKADNLLEFADVFFDSDRDYGAWVDRSFHRRDGTFVSNFWIEYGPEVTGFNQLLERDGWLDPEYSPTHVHPFVQDRELIQQASLAEIRWMLTYFVRGERFSAGLQEQLIRKGFISAILGRLQTLRPELPEK